MEFDEEARDDVNDDGPQADAGELPGDEYVDLNDVSPEDLAELDELEMMAASQDAAAEVDAGPEGPPGALHAEQEAVTPESAASDQQPANLSAEERALQQERIDHPLRFSPVTGERARPGHFYFPWTPPAQSLSMPAASGEFPPAQSHASETSSGETSSRSSPPHDQPPTPSVRAPPGGDNQSPPRQDIGQPLPRLLVTVSLANPQALFDDAMKQASQRMATQFRELAIGEIDWAAFRRNAEKRAADYSLRSDIC